MKMKNTLIIFLLLYTVVACSQKTTKTDAMLFGDVKSENEHIPFINIQIKGTTIGASTDATGHYMMVNIPEGKLIIQASGLGYKTQEKEVVMEKGKTTELFFDLQPDYILTDQVVVSADRNAISRKESPIIINAISPKKLEALNAQNFAQGISFTPGLRIENNCQNCGFTQLRMNGLDGPYSQILIDSRPVLSSLAGVYGLEQIPTSMIERIEVIRGGGSALFGGNAIAGTVNIITKDPILNSFSVGANYNLIGVAVNENSPSNDKIVNFSGSIVSDNLKTGLYIYGVKNERDAWDYNNDSFSEITKIENQTVGFKTFYKPTKLSRIGLEYHSVKEYRRGGNKLDMLAHEADITEMVDFNINSGSLTFEHYLFNDIRHKFSVYTSAQDLKRQSYYGAMQDPNAYGFTKGITSNSGVQLVSKFAKAIFAPSTLIIGLENTFDKLNDTKLGANNLQNSLIANQFVNTIGSYAQNNWEVGKFHILLGLRYDIVNITNLIKDNINNNFNNKIFNPRANILVNLTNDLQLRVSASTGYRVPQVFDEDLHIESSGARRIIHRNAPNLKMETSVSYTTSVNYTKTFGKIQTEFLLEGFYTNLKNAFVSSYQMQDTLGTLLSLRENTNSLTSVKGINFELNLAPSQKFNVQIGGTLQKSEYNSAQQWGEDSLSTSNQILRTPSSYGYLIINWEPINNFKASFSGNYTGQMFVPHFAGGLNSEGNLIENETLVSTKSFFDINLKLTKKMQISELFSMEISTGIQNILQAYQSDFDYGINRDAGYIYGPIKPRTIFFGLKFIY